MYFFDLGYYAKAIADWEVVLQLDPNHSSAKIGIEKAKRKM